MNQVRRIISIVLVISMLFSLTSCGKSAPNATLPDPNGQTIAENIQTENIITENELHEFITEEIYLNEIVIAEEKITELLLEEETISEVQLCTTIYVPQEHIEDFSENSQTAQLFGDDVDISALLTKVAVGTGVIVTLVVLKKVGLPDPIASVVVAAADESLKFAGGGAAVGSLFGGLTGAADEINESERTSATIGFAKATVELILSIVSLALIIPSGGTSAIGVATGVKLVIAGISVLAATAGTIDSGNKAVKTYQSTDGTDIDWNNIDWNAVGVSAAEQAINYGADGYMWGSIVGAVYGGAEGYESYHKYNAPYTEYDDNKNNNRLMHTPKDGNGGHWSGARGESEFILDEPIKDSKENKITTVSYRNAVPDFSPFAEAEVNIPKMTNKRTTNFSQADSALAEYWTRINYKGKSWTASDVRTYRRSNGLTWHEMSNMQSMQLVPYEVNKTFTHCGGVAEYNAMIGREGEADFD